MAYLGSFTIKEHDFSARWQEYDLAIDAIVTRTDSGTHQLLAGVVAYVKLAGQSVFDCQYDWFSMPGFAYVGEIGGLPAFVEL